MRPARFGAVVATVSAVLAASPATWADDRSAPTAKKICSDAYTLAQTLRDAHQLKQAREQLRLCSQPTCKDFIIKDCSAWLTDVEGRLPGVVLAAKDSRGQALINVTVTVDGQPLAQKLEGTTVDVDPGPHTFAFVAEDGTHAEQTYVVLEGQKTQLVAVTIPTGAAPAPPPIQAASQPEPKPGPKVEPQATAEVGTAAPASFWTPMRYGGVAVAGVGAVGVVVGSIFGAMTLTAAHQQTVDCASATVCANHAQALTDHTNATSDGTIANLGLIGGAVLVAGGAALILAGGPDSPAKPAATTLRIVPSFGPSVAGVMVTAAFY